MLPQGHGAIFFTGASASVKGYALPCAAWPKPRRGVASPRPSEVAPPIRPRPDELLDPTAIVHSYMAVLKQPRSAWSLEVALRPCGNWFGTQSIWC